MIEADEITLPARWASYLVNGDASGLDEGEAKRIDLWLEQVLEPGWHVVDVVSTFDPDTGEYQPQEPRFTWLYELFGGNSQGGDVLDYVIHKVS